MRSKSNKSGWSDKKLAQRATAIGVVASGSNRPGSTADQLLHNEFTRDEMKRALKYIESGKDVTGR